MLRLTPILALTGPLLAQGSSGWAIDTTLKTNVNAVAAAADGDLVVATRNFGDEEAAIEIHRYDATLGRHVLEETVRGASWRSAHWRGFSADLEGGLAAVYSRPVFAVGGTVHLLERLAGNWSLADVDLPISSTVHDGVNVAVSGRRVVSVTAGVFQPLELHFIEEVSGGGWDVVQSLEVSNRAIYPPDNPGFLALDGDLAIVTSSAVFPSRTFALCARNPMTGVWAEEQLLVLPDIRLAPAGAAVEGDLVVLGGGRSFAGGTVVSAAWVLERSPSGSFTRVQEIRRLGYAPFGASNVALEGGRLLLAAGDDVHVFERNAAGTFDQVAQYDGLGATVALLDGAAPGTSQGSGPSRVVGLDGRVVRVAPFPLPAVPGAPYPTFGVRQDVGVVTCHPAAVAVPELRYFDVPSVFPFGGARRAATIESAAPGATVLAFASPLPGFSPAAGGALCLDRASLYLAVPPAQADPTGTLMLDLSASVIPLPGALGEGFHLQALVLDPAGPRLTNAIHFVK